MNRSVSEYRFERLCGHFGGGNPAGGLWIIGIEEGGYWTSAQEADEFIERRGDQSYDSRQPGDPDVKRWRITPIVSKICHGITGLGGSWQEFRNEHFLTRSGPLFITNMYPLAKPSAGYVPDSYAEWFGIVDANDYRVKTENSGRFDVLRDMWLRNTPRITLCHGKGSWGDFRSLLSLQGRPENIDGGRIQAYEAGVFLTPHLSWSVHMPESAILELVKYARCKW